MHQFILSITKLYGLLKQNRILGVNNFLFHITLSEATHNVINHVQFFCVNWKHFQTEDLVYRCSGINYVKLFDAFKCIENTFATFFMLKYLFNPHK